MKKMISLLSAITLCFLLLASCSGSQPENESSETAKTESSEPAVTASEYSSTDIQSEETQKAGDPNGTVSGAEYSEPNDQSEELRDISELIENAAVIKYPTLDGNEYYDYTPYIDSKLSYPSLDTDTDPYKSGDVYTVKFFGVTYKAKYRDTRKYADATSFLSDKAFDVYYTTDNTEVEVFCDSGIIKKVHVTEDELKNSPKLITDFSETTMKETAEKVLRGIYGSALDELLYDYYDYEYAKLFSYENSALNRYVVSYRAYINSVPTDDVLYVQFTTSGKLLSISAQRFGQYINADAWRLLPIDQMESKITAFLEQMDYTKISLRDKEPPRYYTMNTEGELYYVTEWEAFKAVTEDEGVTRVETIAIKAMY